jgi:hypothetical protein
MWALWGEKANPTATLIKDPDPVPEAVVTGWHLLSGKERGGSDEDSS